MSDNSLITDSRPRRNLRSLIIEPFKQIKFGLYVIGIAVAFVGLCALMFVKAFVEQYEHVMGIFNVVDPNQRWELVTNTVFYDNAIRIGALFVGFIAVLFLVVFRLTHRYYGPLISIERFVDQIARGEYHRRCKIREKDELVDLVAKLNAMADAIERRHGSEIDAGTGDESSTRNDQIAS